MAKYDVEMLLEDIETTLKENLNAKILEINEEKSDGLELKEIDQDAYYLQNLSPESLANHDPIIVIGLDDVETVRSGGHHAAKRYSLSAILLVAESGAAVDTTTRILRYSRALEECMVENWKGGRGGVKFEFKSLVPIPLTSLNGPGSYRATGVSLEANLG